MMTSSLFQRILSRTLLFSNTAEIFDLSVSNWRSILSDVVSNSPFFYNRLYIHYIENQSDSGIYHAVVNTEKTNFNVVTMDIQQVLQEGTCTLYINYRISAYYLFMISSSFIFLFLCVQSFRIRDLLYQFLAIVFILFFLLLFAGGIIAAIKSKELIENIIDSLGRMDTKKL